jgi:hypothetical protein
MVALTSLVHFQEQNCDILKRWEAKQMRKGAVAIQRAFYAATAESYDQAHDADEKNHGFSLAEQFNAVSHRES